MPHGDKVLLDGSSDEIPPIGLCFAVLPLLMVRNSLVDQQTHVKRACEPQYLGVIPGIGRRNVFEHGCSGKGVQRPTAPDGIYPDQPGEKWSSPEDSGRKAAHLAQ